MLNKIDIGFCKLNFLFPAYLGPDYLRYKKSRLKDNYFCFEPSGEVIEQVNRAIDTVPYYRRELNTHISNISEFSRRIGFINKEIIMNNWEEFVCDNLDKSKIVTGTTGGTSGKPLKIILPRKRYVFELTTLHTMWANVGWNGHVRGVIRNQHLKGSQIYKVDPFKKEVIFDGFKTSDDYFLQVYQVLLKNKIVFIHAYPSSAYQFASFLYRERLDVGFIKAFLCGSEALLPEQKELIEQRLGIKIYHWYGHSEKLVLGGYCSNSDLIHIEPTYGYFELIDDDGQVITEVGRRGEIVGTTLQNPYMPLIRYKTGDYAEYAGDYCKECKRHLPLIKNILGRRDINQIYLKDHTYISITALNLHDDLYSYIEGMQYIQKNIGKLDILIIKGEGYTKDVEQRFKKHFELSFNHKCDFTLSYVTSLIKEPNGKFLPLKQFVS